MSLVKYEVTAPAGIGVGADDRVRGGSEPGRRRRGPARHQGRARAAGEGVGSECDVRRSIPDRPGSARRTPAGPMVESAHGRIAQLVQSTCLTSRGSGVQVPLRPPSSSRREAGPRVQSRGADVGAQLSILPSRSARSDRESVQSRAVRKLSSASWVSPCRLASSACDRRGRGDSAPADQDPGRRRARLVPPQGHRPHRPRPHG